MLQHVPRPTKTYHTEAYPAISPSRPELSLKGKTVLITGGAGGIGRETSNAFAESGVAKLIILARSQEAMTKAKTEIEAAYPNTQVVTYAASITDTERVAEIVKEIRKIDILMLNAGTMPHFSPILQTPMKDIENVYAVNVFGPLALAQAFAALPRDKDDGPRTIIYTSTAGITSIMPGTSAYGSSKIAGTYLARAIAEENKDTDIRAFAFHPAVAFTPLSEEIFGAKEDSMPFDKTNLPANYAVWLCSPEADFLKGRFLWPHWDVEELKAKKDLIENDPEVLKLGHLMGGLVESS